MVSRGARSSHTLRLDSLLRPKIACVNVGVRLIIEDLEGATTVVPLATATVTIGRKEHNTIQLTEQNVSRTHAKLTYRDDGWLIEDLRSYNGVKVNGIPISQPTLLREGDLIQIADYHLTLTDDIDRQTVDIERPRAANDDHHSMAGSSADLPSVSADDLTPSRSVSAAGRIHGAPPQEEEEKKKGAGLWIAIAGVVLLLGGVGAFMVMQNGKGDAKGDDTSGAAKQPDPAPQPQPAATTAAPPADTGAPPADTGAPVEPTPVADTGAPPDADTTAPADTEDVPEIIEEPSDTSDEPIKKPGGGSSSPKSPPIDPVKALADARKKLMSGDSSGAYKLAKAAYDAGHDSEALDVMGVAACKSGSESKAKSTYKKMSSDQRAKLVKVCTPLGINLE